MKMRLGLLLLSLALLTACATNANYSMDDAVKAFRDGDYKLAFKELGDFAAKGDKIAQGLLAQMYRDGLGITQDYAKSAVWYEKAALQGDDDAQMNLGWQYLTGEGVETDYDRAMQWLHKAAAQNNARAELYIGGIYMDGAGVAQDYAQAMHWFHKSSDDGDIYAPEKISALYYFGQGVKPDLDQALLWRKLAAERGNLHSELALSISYRNGTLGVTKDDALADKYYGDAVKHEMTNMNEMRDAMLMIIDSHKSYPPDAVKAKTTGVVRVSFDCPGTTPSHVRVDHSSGDKLLDAAAVTAVEQSEFPPKSRYLTGVNHFVLDINFQLTDTGGMPAVH